jgi:hypothetical protein
MIIGPISPRDMLRSERHLGTTRFQYAARCKPVFFDAPVVMEYAHMEIRGDVERVVAALSDRDRRRAFLLVDRTAGLSRFVAGG